MIKKCNLKKKWKYFFFFKKLTFNFPLSRRQVSNRKLASRDHRRCRLSPRPLSFRPRWWWPCRRPRRSRPWSFGQSPARKTEWQRFLFLPPRLEFQNMKNFNRNNIVKQGILAERQRSVQLTSLVLTTLDQLLLVMIFFHKTSYLNENVNCT